MNKHYFILSLLVVFILGSCNSSKKLANKTTEVEESKSTLIKTYESNRLDFDQIEFNSKLEYTTTSMSLAFDGVIRIQDDKKIWGSFKKFGFEVARMLVTPDSVFVLNRFQKTYMADDLNKLKTMSGVPLEFDDVQQLLLGGSFWTDGLSVMNDSTLTQLQTVQGELIEAIHIFDPTQKIQKSTLNSKNQGSMQVEYENHQFVNNATLAFDREINVQRQGTNVILSLKTQNIDLESKKSFPFEIPSNYTYQSM